MDSFAKSLHRSSTPEVEAAWCGFYKNHFDDLIGLVRLKDDTQSQRRGHDRLLRLDDGSTIICEEKVDFYDKDGTLLEYISNDVTGAPGWMEKPLEVHYLAYYKPARNQFFLYPWREMRRAWKKNRESWIDQARRGANGFRYCEAKNQHYTTHSIVVPEQVLKDAIADSFLTVVPQRGE